MSATNRSTVRTRNHAFDYYVTPIEPIRLFLNEVKETLKFNWNVNTIILDPSAGGDKYFDMSYPKAIKEVYGISNWNIRTLDIREDSRADYRGTDYLDTFADIIGYPDIIITNPPFNLAQEFIEKAINDVTDKGWVIMLLRLNFLESKVRKTFWDKYKPCYIFVHSKRISFTPDGKTDASAYMHCCWQKDHYPEFAQLKVIYKRLIRHF